MEIESLWGRDAPEYVIVGEVTYKGKPLDLRRLIQRRWGWPRKAAEMAADAITVERDELGYNLPIRGEAMFALQEWILEDGDIWEALMEGTALRSSREARSAGMTLKGLEIDLFEAVEDEGLVTGVLTNIAARFGITLEDLRPLVDLSKDQETDRLRIRVGRLD